MAIRPVGLSAPQSHSEEDDLREIIMTYGFCVRRPCLRESCNWSRATSTSSANSFNCCFDKFDLLLSLFGLFLRAFQLRLHQFQLRPALLPDFLGFYRVPTDDTAHNGVYDHVSNPLAQSSRDPGE